MKEVTLRIENMHCGACVRRVTQALERVEGVKVEEVRIGAARVEASEHRPAAEIVKAVERAGYAAFVEQ
ncbi:heavy-metal-associated domain-containing protein [Paracidobacterium acidisoli]|uniref:Copper chaperone n=1 Tax=Paracidobacterium acidisoli TaxID=2303751 RepID=A0A372IV04_9BACT|nr:heavy-metal-associated domain-containing protein [Paracidobacterium acidisoli]MBT9329954.1 heavy-metal-associated domain-containing protein [Paracidobacterium acidisoli]